MLERGAPIVRQGITVDESVRFRFGNAAVQDLTPVWAVRV